MFFQLEYNCIRCNVLGIAPDFNRYCNSVHNIFSDSGISILKEFHGRSGLPSLGCVKLTYIVPCEGLPSDSYKLSVSTLSQSLAQYSAAIIQFPASDGALLRSGLESAHLYFHQRASYPAAEMIHNNDSRE